MDNDIKVSNPSSRGKDIFLRDDLLDSGIKPQVYSLEDEFAKTKKNRNYLLYVCIAAFVALLIGITWFVSATIEERSKHVNISIQDFEDIKLRDLLNSAKGVEGQLMQKQQELSDLRVAMERDLSGLRDRYARKADLTRDEVTDPAQLKTALAGLDRDRSAEEDSLRGSYAARLDEKAREIDAIKKSMQTYDQKLLASAQKSEDTIDNAKKLQDLEIQKVRNYYEDRLAQKDRDHEKEIRELREFQQQLTATLILRYNPVYTSGPLKNALSNYADAQNRLVLRDFRSELTNDGILTRNSFQTFRDRLSSWQILMDRLRQTPYTNSVPLALSGVHSLTIELVSEYEALWYGLADSISKRDREIERFRYALSAYSQQHREDGFILDPRDSTNILAYVDSLYPVKPGDIALVFRGDDEYIGKVRLFPDHEMVRAETVELSNSIQPLDKLLINYLENPQSGAGR
jgi:hypothetical protein